MLWLTLIVLFLLTELNEWSCCQLSSLLAHPHSFTTPRDEYIFYMCSCVSLTTGSSELPQTNRPYLTGTSVSNMAGPLAIAGPIAI